jgi:hypothetical protein
MTKSLRGTRKRVGRPKTKLLKAKIECDRTSAADPNNQTSTEGAPAQASLEIDVKGLEEGGTKGLPELAGEREEGEVSDIADISQHSSVVNIPSRILGCLLTIS